MHGKCLLYYFKELLKFLRVNTYLGKKITQNKEFVLRLIAALILIEKCKQLCIKLSRFLNGLFLLLEKSFFIFLKYYKLRNMALDTFIESFQ